MRPANLGAGSIRMASQSKMRPDLAHHPGDRCLFRTVVSGPPDGYLLSHPRAAAAYLAGFLPHALHEVWRKKWPVLMLV